MTNATSTLTPASPWLWKAPPPAAPVKVLIVDDEESVRNFVKSVLDSAGYETAVAADGQSAMEIAFSRPAFDLLLTDLMMPEMRGDELAEHLRAHDSQLKVLYFTGFSQHLFDSRPALWDNEAFLDKPSSVTAILRAVSQLTPGQTED
jgi:two-component system cell cycle sensor histidine kinase/response regulator CckA